MVSERGSRLSHESSASGACGICDSRWSLRPSRCMDQQWQAQRESARAQDDKGSGGTRVPNDDKALVLHKACASNAVDMGCECHLTGAQCGPLFEVEIVRGMSANL